MISKLNLPESIKKLINELGDRQSEMDTTIESEQIAELIDNFKQNEKIVYAVMNNITFDYHHQAMRRKLIENKILQSVILLPVKLLSDTNISISIIVLSENNESIMCVDASNLFHPDTRHRNTLTDDDIKAISNACLNETEYSVKVDYSEIIDAGYSIEPKQFVVNKFFSENFVRFDELITGYRCGLQLRPEEKEMLCTESPTEYQYLEPKNIFNGEIDVRLPYLSEYRESYQNHRVKNHNIVISKLGRPLKIAVAEIPDDKTVIAVGRLYIFDIDEEKVNPCYIKKFLSSDMGQEILISCSESLTMNNLKIERLLKMPIQMEE